MGWLGIISSAMIRTIWFLPLALVLRLSARELPPLPTELAAYVLAPAPETTALLLKKGDRLAICGDSLWFPSTTN